MSKFRILHITNNMEDYPEAIKDSDKHPELVRILEDEYEMFVYDDDGGYAYPAKDFFYLVELEEFQTGADQLEEELHIATDYIRSTRKQCGGATNSHEEHLACFSALTDAPILNGNRIELRGKDKTYLAMKKEKQ